MAQALTKPNRLNLRTTDRQEHLLRRAAAAADQTVTEFVLASATLQAERVLADRRWFFLDDAGWAEFNELLNAPVEDFPELARFMHTAPVVDLEGL